MLQSAQFPASDNEHNLLIDAYSKSGNVQKAINAFDARPSLGFKLHVRSFNILLNCFCQHGMVPQAEELWARMARMGLEPDMVTYNTMLDLYCR
jgi:pentatricopeptide repeat protein